VQVYLDPDELRDAASMIEAASAEYLHVGARVAGHALGLYPPDVAAHVAATSAMVAARLAGEAAHLRGTAAELRVRAAVADRDWSSVFSGSVLSLARYRWSKARGGGLEWEKSLFEREHSWFERSRSGRAGVVDWKTGSSAGVSGKGSATAKIGRNGAQAEVGIEGKIGTEAHASGQIGGDGLNAAVAGSAFGGARGGASAGGRVGPTGVAANAKADLFVGVEASAKGSATVSGVTSTAKAGVSAGFGAKGEADVQVTASKIRIKAEIGVTLGIGGHGSLDVEVDPKHVINDIRHGIDHGGELIDEAGEKLEHGVSSAKRWVKSLF
jgi:hypothetical protein